MSVIDEYLAKVSDPEKAELERVRRIIKETVPSAEEAISYGMPGYKYKGKYLITFAPFKDHMSIFPGSNPTQKLSEKLKDFKQSKGTIQFTVDKPLPESVIVELVKIRMTDID